jgi:hypothetical protein
MAEASTTLTAIAIGTNQGGGLTWRVQPEPADLGKHFGGRRTTIILDRSFNNGEQLALKRPMVPLSTLPQALYDLIRRILDR